MAENGGGQAQQQAHRCSAAPEPTRQELSDALAEATQELQVMPVLARCAVHEQHVALEGFPPDSFARRSTQLMQADLARQASARLA